MPHGKGLELVAHNNLTIKTRHEKMKKSIKTRKGLKTLLILTTLALTLGGCADGYNKKPDNKLKPSPCACNEPVFNATELGVLDKTELGFFNKTKLS